MKAAVLMSGGFDSIATALLTPDDVEYVFFNYGQRYMEKELKEARKFCRIVNKFLNVYTVLGGSTDMPGRNFLFILKLEQLGYDEVYMGIRNPTPIGDRFKDSNYVYLKLCSLLFGIKVRFPVMWWTKKRVFRYIRFQGMHGVGYNCYNNNDDYLACNCSNCIERRKYQ